MDKMRIEFVLLDSYPDQSLYDFAKDVIVHTLTMSGKDPIVETMWTNNCIHCVYITTLGNSRSDEYDKDTIRLKAESTIAVEHVNGVDRLVVTDTGGAVTYIPMDLPTSHYIINRFINRVAEYSESLRNRVACVNARALHVASEIYQDNIVKGRLNSDAAKQRTGFKIVENG